MKYEVRKQKGRCCFVSDFILHTSDFSSFIIHNSDLCFLLPLTLIHPARMMRLMPRVDHPKFSPRIANRRAFHQYEITAKLECGIMLTGSEVKSLRQGHGHINEAFARIENGTLLLYGMHIDPYDKATLAWNHDPNRTRRLLAHKREINKLASEMSAKNVTLVPLAVYFKNGLVKVELGVGRGKKQFDKRESIKRREQDRELRRMVAKRG